MPRSRGRTTSTATKRRLQAKSSDMVTLTINSPTLPSSELVDAYVLAMKVSYDKAYDLVDDAYDSKKNAWVFKMLRNKANSLVYHLNTNSSNPEDHMETIDPPFAY